MGGGDPWGNAGCHIKNWREESETAVGGELATEAQVGDPSYCFPEDDQLDCGNGYFQRFCPSVCDDSSSSNKKPNGLLNEIENFDQSSLNKVEYTSSTGGKCQLLDGSEPVYESYDDQPDCESLCTEDSSCYGYSLSNDDSCMLWKESSIIGGGESWNGAGCHIKNDLAEVQVGGSYQYIRGGKCRTTFGRDPTHEYFHGRSDCEGLCDRRRNCYGYSRSRYGNCLLWTQRNIKGGGARWGNAGCHIKRRRWRSGALEAIGAMDQVNVFVGFLALVGLLSFIYHGASFACKKIYSKAEFKLVEDEC